MAKMKKVHSLSLGLFILLTVATSGCSNTQINDKNGSQDLNSIVIRRLENIKRIAFEQKSASEYEKETIEMFESNYLDFINSEYDREPSLFKKLLTREKYVAMHLVELDTEILNIIDIIRKSKIAGKTQQEVLSQLKVIFATKRLILDITTSQLKKEKKGRLSVTREEFEKDYLQGRIDSKNLYPHVDKLRSIFTNSLKEGRSPEEQGRHIENGIISFVNDFDKKHK